MTLDPFQDKLEKLDREIAASKQTNAALTSAVVEAPRPESWWSNQSAMTISAVVLVFGFLVLCLATYLINSGRRSESVLRLFGTVLIVISAVFLVVAGYSDTQIAPVMGLLGTIVGYLLGKDTRAPEPPPARGKETDNTPV